ncbi:hypothetical protein ACIQXD_35185 [Streptomyces uncialis]|uniref:hypothetical protein n=1 Tax=Streptomyces uncialis TaxID=1048205 RepID=UPI003826B287
MADQKGLPKGTRPPAKATDPVVGAAGGFSAADALNAFSQLVRSVGESVRIHDTEATKREKLRTYRETEVARIKASEKTLRIYFDRVFEERSETHKRLFEGLDRAVESGDAAAMQTFVGGIIEVARTSPLASIGDLGELKRAMDNPSTVFEL